MISSGAKWPVLHHGVQHVNPLFLKEKVVGSWTLNLWCVDAGAGARFKGVDEGHRYDERFQQRSSVVWSNYLLVKTTPSLFTPG